MKNSADQGGYVLRKVSFFKIEEHKWYNLICNLNPSKWKPFSVLNYWKTSKQKSFHTSFNQWKNKSGNSSLKTKLRVSQHCATMICMLRPFTFRIKQRMKKVSSDVKFILTHNDASIVLEKPKSDIKTLQTKPTPCAYPFLFTAQIPLKPSCRNIQWKIRF